GIGPVHRQRSQSTHVAILTETNHEIRILPSILRFLPTILRQDRSGWAWIGSQSQADYVCAVIGETGVRSLHLPRLVIAYRTVRETVLVV
ncbi:hypothetical protein, partial [Arthrobacter sp. AQ5-05]|uniref:hypothetical protein n=1 Tax=Arthrobacter sp. AQ5-05 TaxID=2184581 RepID=UPI001C65FBA5